MSDNNNDKKMSPEQAWKHLRDDGTKILLNIKSNDLISDKPKWLDEERFALAKEAIQKYYIG